MKKINNFEEYNQLVNESNKPILLDFYADWCGPCQAMLPTVEKLSDEFNGQVTMHKVNIEEVPELASLYKVRSIPNLVFIKEKEVVKTHVGMAAEKELRAHLEAIVN